MSWTRYQQSIRSNSRADISSEVEAHFRVVKRVVVRGVPLAQKDYHVKYRLQIERIKREISIGTYQSTSHGNSFRHILTFPVAVCDLEQLLAAFEALRNTGEGYTLGTQCQIGIRLLALEFAASLSPPALRAAVVRRLLEMTGCITKAMWWIHSQNVQHRDLKPHNILLRPQQIYLTSFGMSRAASNATTQWYSGHSAGYSAPEVIRQGDVNPA